MAALRTKELDMTKKIVDAAQRVFESVGQKSDGALDVVILRDQEDHPLTDEDAPEFRQALATEAPKGATHAYLANIRNDDGAVVVFSKGPLTPKQVVKFLASPDYGIKANPSQIEQVEW